MATDDDMPPLLPVAAALEPTKPAKTASKAPAEAAKKPAGDAAPSATQATAATTAARAQDASNGVVHSTPTVARATAVPLPKGPVPLETVKRATSTPAVASSQPTVTAAASAAARPAGATTPQASPALFSTVSSSTPAANKLKPDILPPVARPAQVPSTLEIVNVGASEPLPSAAITTFADAANKSAPVEKTSAPPTEKAAASVVEALEPQDISALLAPLAERIHKAREAALVDKVRSNRALVGKIDEAHDRAIGKLFKLSKPVQEILDLSIECINASKKSSKKHHEAFEPKVKKLVKDLEECVAKPEVAQIQRVSEAEVAQVDKEIQETKAKTEALNAKIAQIQATLKQLAARKTEVKAKTKEREDKSKPLKARSEALDGGKKKAEEEIKRSRKRIDDAALDVAEYETLKAEHERQEASLSALLETKDKEQAILTQTKAEIEASTKVSVQLKARYERALKDYGAKEYALRLQSQLTEADVNEECHVCLDEPPMVLLDCGHDMCPMCFLKCWWDVCDQCNLQYMSFSGSIKGHVERYPKLDDKKDTVAKVAKVVWEFDDDFLPYTSEKKAALRALDAKRAAHPNKNIGSSTRQ